MEASKHCEICGDEFRPRPQKPQQSICSKASCQLERQRRWLQKKRQQDADYRDNDARGQRNWREAHPDYWRGYREAHPQYVERNRARQQDRDANRRGSNRGRVLANDDVSTPVFPVPSGTYVLTPVTSDLANDDAWTVQISLISSK